MDKASLIGVSRWSQSSFCTTKWVAVPIMIHLFACTLMGCDFVDYPRCHDQKIPKGTIVGDWRGLHASVHCDRGYEYKGHKIECFDYTGCPLQQYTTHACNVTMLFLPDPDTKHVHEIVRPSDDDMKSYRKKHDGSTYRIQHPVVKHKESRYLMDAGDSIGPEDERRLRGGGGGAMSLANVGGDVYGTKLAKWTHKWKLDELQAWAQTVPKCTRVPGYSQAQEDAAEEEELFESSGPMAVPTGSTQAKGNPKSTDRYARHKFALPNVPSEFAFSFLMTLGIALVSASVVVAVVYRKWHVVTSLPGQVSQADSDTDLLPAE